MKVNIITILWGNKYSESDVNKLFSMISKNTKFDVNFYLFSNNSLPDLAEGVIKKPEPANNSHVYSDSLNYRKITSI